MKWKLLLAVAIVLTFIGLLAFTEQGREYTAILGSGARSLANSLSSFVGNFIKVGKENFELELLINKNAIYGQTFLVQSANFSVSGQVFYLKIDEKFWEVEGILDIAIIGEGNVVIDKNGKVSFKGRAKNFKVNGFSVSDVKLEFEIIPQTLLFEGKSRKLNMTPVSGSIVKRVENVEFTSNISQATLSISDFSGFVEIGENARLIGTVSELEINGKRF